MQGPKQIEDVTLKEGRVFTLSYFSSGENEEDVKMYWIWRKNGNKFDDAFASFSIKDAAISYFDFLEDGIGETDIPWVFKRVNRYGNENEKSELRITITSDAE